jgi:hypothetical protein
MEDKMRERLTALVIALIAVWVLPYANLVAAVSTEEQERQELRKSLINPAGEVVVPGHRLLRPRAEMQVANVLSIDGGGVRGIIAARFLEELERSAGKPIADLFDLIVGTSTGGILGLGLVAPSEGNPSLSRHTASNMVKFYETLGGKIFPQKGFVRGALEAIPSLFYSYKYSATPLEEELRAALGDTQLKFARTPIVITSYDDRAKGTYLFKSHRARLDGGLDFYMRDVARATSAAPTYFPVAEIGSIGGIPKKFKLVDGGMGANNPAIEALDEARNLFGHGRHIRLISVGTGHYPNGYEFCGDVPYVLRAGQTISQLFDAQSHRSSETMKAKASDPNLSYYRFQPFLQKDLVEMDRSDNIGRIREEVDRVIDAQKQGVNSITKLADLLKSNSREKIPENLWK